MIGGAWRRAVVWPVSHPILALVLAGVIAVLSGVSVSRVRPDPSVEAMFSRQDPSAAALARWLNDFATSDQLIVLASAPASQAGEQPDRLLAFGERFRAAVGADADAGPMAAGVIDRADAETTRFVERVVGPSAMYYLDDADFVAAQRRLTRESIFDQVAQDRVLLSAPGPAAQGFAQLMRADPLRLHEFAARRLAGRRVFKTYRGGDALISPDGRSLLIRVLGRKPPSDLEFCRRFSDGIERVARRANTDGLTIELAGAYPIAAASERAIRRDMIESVVGSVVLLQALFVLAFRNPFKLFALAFGPVALGVFFGFGAYGVFATRLTPVTGVLGAILAGMGIDYSIQYLCYYEWVRSRGEAPADAARRVAVEMSPAVLAAWATSVVGFVAVGASHVKALRDFSILGTLGLTGAFACAVVLLPAMLALTDRRPAGAVRSRARLSVRQVLEAAGRRPGVLLGVGASVFIASFVALLLRGGGVLPLESDLTVMHPHPNPAIEAQVHIAERFGVSPGAMAVHLRADSEESLVTLAYDVSRRLDSDASRADGIAGTFGLATLLPDPRVIATRRGVLSRIDPNAVVADFNAALDQNGFEPSAFDDYARFLKRILTPGDVPIIETLRQYPRVADAILPRTAFEGSPINEAVTLVLINRSIDVDRAAREKVVTALRGRLAGLPGATLTGLDVVSRDTEDRVRSELPRLLVIALAAAAGYLLIHFRNWRDPLLSLIPAVFGLVVAAATLRVMGQNLNMLNLIAAPLLIGIDVDYGIFLVSVARSRSGREAGTPDETGALENTGALDPTVRAVALCASATFLGYISLLWTSVPAERSLGVAAAVGIATCLLGVLIVLLPVLARRAK